MAISQSVFQTLSCDGPGCNKSEVIEASDAVSTTKLLEENPWIKNHRIVQTMSKRDPATNQPVVFHFCSDVCLVNAATAGMFVPTEEKKVELPVGTGNAQIREALAARAREKAADQALRNGDPVNFSPKA